MEKLNHFSVNYVHVKGLHMGSALNQGKRKNFLHISHRIECQGFERDPLMIFSYFSKRAFGGIR